MSYIFHHVLHFAPCITFCTMYYIWTMYYIVQMSTTANQTMNINEGSVIVMYKAAVVDSARNWPRFITKGQFKELTLTHKKFLNSQLRICIWIYILTVSGVFFVFVFLLVFILYLYLYSFCVCICICNCRCIYLYLYLYLYLYMSCWYISNLFAVAGVCRAMKAVDGGKFYKEYLLKTSFKGDSFFFKFHISRLSSCICLQTSFNDGQLLFCVFLFDQDHTTHPTPPALNRDIGNNY